MADTDVRQAREIQNLRQELGRLQGRFRLLSHLSQQIVSSLDLSTVFRDIVRAACELTEARYGAIGIFDEDGRIQEFITHGIGEEERARIGRLPHGMGLLGYLQHSQQPVRLADLAQHPMSIGFPPHHPPMKSFLGLPLRFRDEALGNLYLTEKARGEDFTPEDEALLALFAAQAALAIRNAKAHDEVERHRIEAEHERTELEALVQTSPVGILVVGADGIARRANREAGRILGSADPLAGGLDRYLATCVLRHADGRPYDPKATPFSRALELGEAVLAEEVRFDLPDGRSLLTLVNAVPSFSADGDVAGGIIVLQDLTLLEEAEQLRHQFLSMVSHELKTPLTAVKGTAAMALGSQQLAVPSELREMFKIIDEQADRLTELVNNLLDVSRIEAGAFSVSPGPLDLGLVLDDVSSTFHHGPYRNELRILRSDPPAFVWADRNRVTQVLFNLLNNAAKFSPPDAPIIVSVEEGDGQVVVRVRDKGRGIPPDKIPLLFQRFSQVHDDSGSRLRGSGLGLAISKGIVEAHGGRIWVESDGPGLGSTFSFTLPAAAPGQDWAALGRPPDAPMLRRSGEKLRVLAADDDVQSLRLLRRSLEEAGYQAVVTGDPNEALKLAELLAPDLVLLDLMFPEMNGFDLLRRLREFTNVPVIFVTARGSDTDAARGLQEGADDYVSKPFSPVELIARIETVLRRRARSGESGVRPPFVLGDLRIEFAERRVFVSSQLVPMTPTEYKLLYELAVNAGRPLTHDQLLRRIWGEAYGGTTDLLRSMVRNLRRKLGDDARQPRYILTELAVGYRMPQP